MDINNLISHYGYAALIIGSMAEGETITLLGGVVAHQGLLKFPLVVISGSARRHDWRSGALPARTTVRRAVYSSASHAIQARIRKAQRLIKRHPYLFVIGTRFMYGFRVIGPLLIGASGLPPKIFLPLNIVGAIIWALLFTTLGYLGGEAIGPWLHHLDAHLKHIIWLVLVIVLVIALRWWLKRREAKQPQE
ncbi:Inner membrane protein yohD [Kluyvera intermedia]|nr:Inner membrane protein yohD [Kluyvera intermedia]